MRIFLVSLVAAIAILTTLPTYAADLFCLETVTVNQTGTAPAPEWTVSYSTSPIQLEMVPFYSGPPKDEASLMYDTWTNAKDIATASWKLPKDSRGYWIKCSYRGTTLELSKALPPTVSSCRVTYERQAASSSGLPAIKRIDCK